MFLKNMIIGYSILLLKSNEKKSFEGLGKLIQKSGDTIFRRLPLEEDSAKQMAKNAQKMFHKSKILTAPLDDTLVKKISAEYIEGIWPLYDQKTRNLVNGFRFLVISVTDGKRIMPIKCNILLPKTMDLLPEQKKIFIVQQLICEVKRIFFNKKIIVAADGAFASQEILKWCIQENVNFEMRMASNRVIEYKNKKNKVRDLGLLIPNGKRRARTIKAIWHDISLSITACRRINKDCEESIVFQVANFDASPSEHVQFYKNRWGIETLFRTIKQKLGLQECFSRKFDAQIRHMNAVLLAYSIAQLESKQLQFKNPEEAIRYFRSSLCELEDINYTFQSCF
jgi:hypothetical protein